MTSFRSSFKRVKVNDYNYLYIIASYFESQSAQDRFRSIMPKFQRFGAMLRTSGNVTIPDGAVDERIFSETFNEIVDLDWERDIKWTLTGWNNPVLLVIDTDFEYFEPKKDQWGLVELDEEIVENLDRIFEELVLITTYEGDVYRYLRDLREGLGSEYPKIFTSAISATRRLPENSVFGKVSKAAQYQCDIFVLMPFADKYTAVFTDVIKDLGNELDLEVKRGDDFYSNQHIIDEIWHSINNCNVVIADCSDRNPNVFYELGIAHTLGKPTILISRDEADAAPFDIGSRRIIQYEDTVGGAKKLKSELMSALEKVLKEGE